VIALSTTRNRCTVPLAALLLVIQGLAGGAVALAHAAEPVTAPPHVEAQHDARCVVLHDELRCALCHYASSRVVPQPVRAAPAQAALTARPRSGARRAPAVVPAHLTAPPRAPPTSHS
jgi:hypothetical protein